MSILSILIALIFSRISWSDQMSLFISYGDQIHVCNIKRRDINEVRTKDLPQFMVEIVYTIPLEGYWISGIAPMDKLIVLLTTPKVICDEDDEDEDGKPQLMIIEPLDDDYNVVSTDYLKMKNHEEHSVHDLHLEFLLHDQNYFIVSPKEIFFGKPRDEDDHVEWLISQKDVSTFDFFSCNWGYFCTLYYSAFQKL